MTELYRHVGEYTDVPAGDTAWGSARSATSSGGTSGSPRPLRVRRSSRGRGWNSVAPSYAREATGYGLVFFLAEMLAVAGDVGGRGLLVRVGQRRDPHDREAPRARRPGVALLRLRWRGARPRRHRRRAVEQVRAVRAPQGSRRLAGATSVGRHPEARRSGPSPPSWRCRPRPRTVSTGATRRRSSPTAASPVAEACPARLGRPRLPRARRCLGPRQGRERRRSHDVRARCSRTPAVTAEFVCTQRHSQGGSCRTCIGRTSTPPRPMAYTRNYITSTNVTTREGGRPMNCSD